VDFQAEKYMKNNENKKHYWPRNFGFIEPLSLFICIQLLLIIVLLGVLIGLNKEFKEIWLAIDSFISSMLALLITILGGLVVIRVNKTGNEKRLYDEFYSKPYLTFEADFTQVFCLSERVNSLEYSVGEKEWEELGTQSIVFGGTRGKLLLRGMSAVGTDGAMISFTTDAQVICTGDIRTLVDYKHYETVATNDAKFNSLFENCSQLIVAPELPSMDLAESCYLGMFYGCTS
jgi:hypothetical protein